MKVNLLMIQVILSQIQKNRRKNEPENRMKVKIHVKENLQSMLFFKLISQIIKAQ